MLKHFITALALLGILLSFRAPLALAQGATVTTFVSGASLPDSKKTKFPHIDAYSNLVEIAGNANTSDAHLWSKTDTGTSFPTPRRLGDASGYPDYSTATLDYASDGRLYYFWSSADDRRVYVRSRAPGQASFGTTYTVLTASPFPAEATGVVRSDGMLFVFWRDLAGGSRLTYRTSSNGGATWSSTQVVDPMKIQPVISVATGPNNSIAVAYYKDTGNDGAFQTYIAYWNGSGFTRENVTKNDPAGWYGDPSVAITPSGQYVVAFRGIGAGTDGTWYSERQTNGSWPFARLQKGTTDWVSLNSDEFGNLHLFYINKLSGSQRLYYWIKRAGQAFSGKALDAYGGTIFHNDSTTSLRDRVYAHVVLERFVGDTSEGRYLGFSTDILPFGAKTISIANGAATTRDTQLPVSFSNLVGTPTQVRYHWGAAPTDADTWLPFDVNNPVITVDTPALNPAVCTGQTLYTQLRSSTETQLTPNSDSIVFDRAIQATVSLVNPDANYLPTATRTLKANLHILSGGECSGLTTALVSGDGSASLNVNGVVDFYSLIDLTGSAGTRTVNVALSDTIGNLGSLSGAILYDPTPPVQSSAGTVTVKPTFDADNNGQADPGKPNIYFDVTVAGAQASDVASGLYGLLITNTVTPSGGTPTAGATILVPFSQMRQATVSGGQVDLAFKWNITNGLAVNAQVPGTYSFTAVLVDGAGNPAATSLVDQPGIAFTSLIDATYLSLMRRR